MVGSLKRSPYGYSFFFQAEDGIRDGTVTGVQTCALPIWKISMAGVPREFDAEITEQHPDDRVAWKSVDGTGHAGVVTFHRLDDSHTRVTLQLRSEERRVGKECRSRSSPYD